jgi:TetR/AcrR family transcriptional regulator, regulator of cefoperazone and chloramphenicol sensitivity
VKIFGDHPLTSGTGRGIDEFKWTFEMSILKQNRAPDDEGSSTREKILHCACDLFAHQGFQETTVQDICQRAGTNIASVNYHFGSKGKLYLASWVYAAELADDVDGPIEESLPPEEWLKRMVRQRIKVIFSDGPSGWMPRLIHYEIHHQTIYFPKIRQTFLRVVRERFHKQVSAYLGLQANRLQVETGVNAIMGFFPMMIQMREHQKIRLSPKKLEQLTEQTQAYVLGGLAAMKQFIEKDSK